ncbi:bacterio-opsin activator domain-containing protein [Halorientalis brevis]|uniref:Bacterio-opsin activator domain-containing protein n=1 Tax=Halorientalis brevis TaxID=1126241 RepID=A0ABD6C575_9EURY|nr:bacterio-opsin activator domain-containing protein [Halorientalis brevis]
MEVSESITRAALDTLSSQVAVLDAEGHILFTNSAWGTTSNESAPGSEPEGTNYFDSVDPTDDDYATEAVSGIRAVLNGETDAFRLEYPCHSPDQQRWFMMRATSFSLEGRTFATVAHIDITERRLAEIEANENAEQAERERQNLEHLVDRINGLVQDITQLLVGAASREEMEDGVCERLVDTDPYVCAWIGDADFPEEYVEPRAVASTVDVAIESTDQQLGESAGDPSGRALATRTVQIVESAGDDEHLARVYGADNVASLIAIPLVARDASYGVLTVCASEPDAFDEREQVVLEALGRVIANAMNAVQSKRTLTTNRIIEMEVTLADQSLFPCRLSAELDCRLSYSGSVYKSEGLLQEFYTVTGADSDSVAAFADADEDVVGYRLLADHDEESLFQFTFDGSLIDTLVDRGAVTQEVTSENGQARFTVELPQEADAKSLFESLSERYDRVDLVGYHEHERPVQTRQEFRASLEDRLTDRQFTALRTAYYSGFFDWPRGVDGDELAAMMDISRSTFHQHLRVAERKVLDAFFERE